MKNIFGLISLVIILLVSSCAEKISSNDVPTDKVLRFYHVNCTNNGTIYVTAEFYKDGGLTIPPFRQPFGKNIKLDSPSKVLFNGKLMNFNEDVFGEVTYNLKLEKWPEEFTWQWTDKDGKEHTDKAKMNKISFGNNFIQNIGSGKYSVSWQGGAVKKNEEVFCSFDLGESAFQEYAQNIGEKSIVIQGNGYDIQNMSFETMSISRTLMIRNVKEISVENVAGTCIKIVYTHEIQ